MQFITGIINHNSGVSSITSNVFRYSPEEFSIKGKQIYQAILPDLIKEHGNLGKIVAIDIETGVYAIADKTITAADQIFASSPNAQLWFERIGADSVYKFPAIQPDN
jgi:hypothetical protein